MPFPRQLEALQIVDLNIPTPTPSWPPRGGGSPHCLPGRREPPRTRRKTPPSPAAVLQCLRSLPAAPWAS